MKVKLKEILEKSYNYSKLKDLYDEVINVMMLVVPENKHVAKVSASMGRIKGGSNCCC
ncbi:hypothetical protein [Borrelia persica]|uniref:hypothetical protein n=1 Tax=Borrelia persica TaxID=44448 RepID=UPI0004AE9164|nr:hypothetical protein [Borrelia persica]